jgi:PAS domain S-box-containing protein
MNVLKDILDNLTDAIVILDGQGRVVLYNQEALRIQKSISEKPLEIGKSIQELVVEERKKTVSEIFRTLKRQKKPLKNFAEYTTAFGTSIFLEINLIPVLGSKKELRYINVVAQDITSRKILEKKARSVAADVSNLIENAHAIILSVDSRGYIVDWNNHCAELTGFRRQEILSQKLSEVLIREPNMKGFNKLMSAVLENKMGTKYELQFQTRSGGELTVLLSATPRTNAKGEVIGATLVGQDITELTSYRKSLEKLVQNKTAALEQVLKKEKEAVEMKSRFVSIASHEFRTPLSSIDFAASFIKQNAATIGRRKLNEKVKVIEKHVSHMSHLLEDVLNFSKNDNGQIKLFPSDICLDDFIQEVVEEVMCSAKHSHHICVSTNTLGHLMTDEKLLRNIATNLLSNAIKYSPGKEEVCLNVLDHDDVVTLEVRDEGMGIPADELDMIFEPFVRGQAVGTIQGSGLGLSIVKKAVELLNGNIHIESKPGKGSVFKVTIPRQRFIV